MKIFAVVLTFILMVAASAGAQERVGNAAIGAVAGAVVFGPVGAVAGAAVGYTAGKGIARDWGLKRNRPPHRVKRASSR